MRAWILPAAAVSFGTGILLADVRVGTGTGLVLVIAGSLTLLASAYLGRRKRTRSKKVLLSARLLGPEQHLSERDLLAQSATRPEPEDGPKRPPASRVLALLVGFALLGAGWSVVRRVPAEGLQALDGGFVRFQGTIASDPHTYSFGWGADVTLSRLEMRAQVVRLSAKAWLRGRARPPPIEPGESVLEWARSKPCIPGRQVSRTISSAVGRSVSSR